MVYIDRLNNTNYGIPQKDVKDVEKKLSQLGDVCYAGNGKPDLIFFIHTTPAVYHDDNGSLKWLQTLRRGATEMRPSASIYQVLHRSPDSQPSTAVQTDEEDLLMSAEWVLYCPNCKIEVGHYPIDENQKSLTPKRPPIPNEGLLVDCANCKHVFFCFKHDWFYKEKLWQDGF